MRSVPRSPVAKLRYHREVRSRLVLLSCLTLACAFGEEPSNPSEASVSVGITLSPTADPVSPMTTSGASPTTELGTSSPPAPVTSEGSTSTGEDATTGAPTPDATTGPVVVSSGGEACDDACDAPPDDCHAAPGSCVDGTCVYPPAGAGTPCDDGDACTTDDACDGAGACVGAELECTRPNATGGACQGGTCQGFTCVAPWEDCDSDWDNGCEVPTGVPNQCDANGLNAEAGCWTAYCGSLNSPDAANFGAYYCMDCANCHEPSPGQWQWCNHATGNWYAPAAGMCGASKDLVCAP